MDTRAQRIRTHAVRFFAFEVVKVTNRSVEFEGTVSEEANNLLTRIARNRLRRVWSYLGSELC